MRSLVVLMMLVRAAHADDRADIAKLVDAQLAGWDEFQKTKQPPAQSSYLPNALVAMTGGSVSPQIGKFTESESHWVLFGPAEIASHKVRDLRVGIAPSGASAWVAFSVRFVIDGLSGKQTLEYRASELVVKGEHGWLVQAGAWSVGGAHALLVRAAKAGKLGKLETVVDRDNGDRAVIDAFTTLVRDGKGWAGHAAIAGAVWAVTAPDGELATVTAPVDRDDGDTTIPERWFVVFAHEAGVWMPVHLHMAAPAP